jgi:tetrahydromethanopterin S-methyltransferase subunit B
MTDTDYILLGAVMGFYIGCWVGAIIALVMVVITKKVEGGKDD